MKKRKKKTTIINNYRKRADRSVFLLLLNSSLENGHNYGMRKCAVSIEDVKNDVRALVGRKLRVSVNRGRKKVDRYDGEITAIYPSVFVLSVVGLRTGSSLSCSYSDVVCGDIKLKPLTEKKMNKL